MSQKPYKKTKKGSNFEEKKWALNFKLKLKSDKSPFHSGDLVTHKGKREISAVSGRVGKDVSLPRARPNPPFPFPF